MRIALVSDLHGQSQTLGYISQIVANDSPDALILSGDVTTRDNTDFLEKLFKIFSDKNVVAFVIWGNSDGPAARKMIASSRYNANLAAQKIGDDKIYGIGESDLPQNLDSAAIKDSILVTHKPPLSSVLSQNLPNAPRFHVCGHLHTRKIFRKFKATKLIQVPSLINAAYAIFDPQRESVEFKSLK